MEYKDCVGTFIESTAKRFGIVAKQRLLRIFDAFQWPDPEQGEFVRGAESNLLFLDRYGLVLRVGQRCYAPESDLVLSPIASVDAGPDYVVELLPGVRAIAESWEVGQLVGSLLEEDSVNFHDTTAPNVGYVPVSLPGFPAGVPVVLDRGAVSEINHFVSEFNAERNTPDVQALRRTFNREALRGFQKAFYAPLRESFEAAWPKGCHPDRSKIERFLTLCAEEIVKAEAGQPARLCNLWCRDGVDVGKPPMAEAAAAQYDRRLSALDGQVLSPQGLF